MVLVTRSITLSNTLYSVLLEAEGQFLTIGRDWVGSLVKYDQNALCFSTLFSEDDPFYTDQKGINNDECSYFANAIANTEKIYLQSSVFEFIFEIKFNFGEDITLYSLSIFFR